MRSLLILLFFFTYLPSLARANYECQGRKMAHNKERLNKCVEVEDSCKKVFSDLSKVCSDGFKLSGSLSKSLKDIKDKPSETKEDLDSGIEWNWEHFPETKRKAIVLSAGTKSVWERFPEILIKKENLWAIDHLLLKSPEKKGDLSLLIQQIQNLKIFSLNKLIRCKSEAKICYNNCGRSEKCKDAFYQFLKKGNRHLDKLDKIQVGLENTRNQIKDETVNYDPGNYLSIMGSGVTDLPDNRSAHALANNNQWLTTGSYNTEVKPEDSLVIPYAGGLGGDPYSNANHLTPDLVKGFGVSAGQNQMAEISNEVRYQEKKEELDKKVKRSPDYIKRDKQTKEKIRKRNVDLLLERVYSLSGNSVDKCSNQVKKASENKNEKSLKTWCDFLSCATAEMYNKLIEEIYNGTVNVEVTLEGLIDKSYNKNMQNSIKDLEGILSTNSAAKEEIKKRFNAKMTLYKKALQSLPKAMIEFLKIAPDKETISQNLKAIINLYFINQLIFRLGKLQYYTIFHTYALYPKMDSHKNVFGFNTPGGISSLKKIYSAYINLSENPEYAGIKKAYKSDSLLSDAGEFMFSCMHCLSDIVDQPRSNHDIGKSMSQKNYVKHIINKPQYEIKKRPLYLAKNFLIKALKNLSKKELLLEDHFEVLVYKDMIKNFVTKGRADTSVLKNLFFLIRDPNSSAAEYSELFNALAKYGVYYYDKELRPYIPENYFKSSNDYFSSKNVTARWINSIIGKWPTNNDEIKEDSHKISICRASELIDSNIFVKDQEEEKKNFYSALKYYCSQ